MHSTYWGHIKYTPGIYPMELRIPGMHLLVHAIIHCIIHCIRYHYQKLGTNSESWSFLIYNVITKKQVRKTLK